MALYRHFTTQQALDAEYDVGRSVTNFPAIIDFYERESARAREDLPNELDVPYGPTRAEHLDIFCAERPAAPILIFFHGGYWRSLSSKEYNLVARGPVSAGVTTLLVNYALCPDVTIDEIVRQSRAAVAWAYRNAASFGGDRNRIYVAGHSAGGHLAAMAMQTDWEADYGLPADLIKGGCVVSGLFDLAPLPYTFVQQSLQLTWGEVLRNSPILHLPDKAAPLIVSYGGHEPGEFRRQSDAFLEAWQAKGLDGTLIPQPSRHHFNAIADFMDAKSPLCGALLRMMRVAH